MAWQREHGRHDLPWQRSRDPYRVWVSEIMLQQTRVDTVLRYYEPFLRRFPDVRALAAAELDEVLAQWSGLGYYRRARNLHACARQVCERHGGEFPRSREGLEALAGIGQYLHGEVVGLGMWLSTALGEDLGVQSPASAARLRDVLVRAGLPTRLPRVAAARWLELLPVDRDGPQGMLELVLLEEVGRPQVRRVPPSAVLEALDKAGALSSG